MGYFRANENYIPINITVLSSKFHILHNERIASIYAVICVLHFGQYLYPHSCPELLLDY